MAAEDSFRPCWKSSYANCRQRLTVIPRRPLGGLLRQLAGVFLQLRQIVRRIGAAQFTSVDEAHEESPTCAPFSVLWDGLFFRLGECLPNRN